MKRKGIINNLCIIVCCICILACENDKQETYPDIQVGKYEALNEIVLNKKNERSIILFGGNGKYHANVVDSKIAQVKIIQDTLKIKGLLEGETLATIISHNKKKKLKIQVTYPQLGFSHESVTIRPNERTNFVSLSGGGENAKLEEDDPEDVIETKWDASSGHIEIKGLYEGKAKLVAISEDGSRKSMDVQVKVEDELTVPGIYGTNRRYFSSNQLCGNTMVVKRKGVGVWFINCANPYGGQITQYLSAKVVKVTPAIVNPKVGEYINIKIEKLSQQLDGITAGTHHMLIEDVRESTVVLRKREFKILMPYDKE